MKRIVYLSIVFIFALIPVVIARPIITGLTKTEGPIEGGSYVGIIGENFNKTTYFMFGTRRAITKRFVSSSLVYVMTCENTIGSKSIKAFSKDELPSAAFYSFSFTNEAPVLESININNGPSDGNTVVHYYGKNFRPNLTLNFGSNESLRRGFYHSDRMYSYTPAVDLAEADFLTVDVKMTNSDLAQTVLEDGFTFQKNPPNITRIWPNKGIKQGGTLLRVWGSNFRATDRWYIGDQEIQFYYPSTNKIIRYGNSGFVYLKTESSGAASVGQALDIRVEPADDEVGVGSKTAAFTYTTDAPEFVTVYPNKGFASGSTLYIRGKNISNDAVINFLKLDSEDATSDNQATITSYYHDGIIRVKTAPRLNTPPTGTLVDVQMENDNGIAKNLGGFMFWDLAPRIHYIYPNNGLVTGNQYVYIRGRNFKNDDIAVSFLNQEDPLVYRVYNSGYMAIKTKPAAEVGPVDVSLISQENGSATLQGGYVYTQKSPLLTSIWPLADSQDGNRNLYLNGENFTPETKVYIDGGDPIDLNYFYHSRRIRIKTPPHVPGKVSITVETAYGNPVTLENIYRYFDAPPGYPEGTAIINYISPLSGTRAGGAYVYLYGKNLTKDTKVFLGDEPANIIRVHSSGKRITIFTPATDMIGSVDISTTREVDGDLLDFTLEQAFNYTEEKPDIKMIYPANGFVYGGTYITVYGTNLTKDTKLQLGGKTAILKRFYHSGAARYLTSPADQPASVDVDVISQFGSDSLTKAYQYATFAPQVRAITPNHGSMNGGNWIRIYGSFFTPDTVVMIDGKTVPENEVKYYHTQYLIAKAPQNETTHHKTTDIEIKTPYGSVVEKNSYTYVHPDVRLSEAK